MDKYKKLKITGILLLYPTIFSVIIGPVTVSANYTFSMALGTVFVISLFTSLPIGIGLIAYVWKKKRKEQKTKDLDELQFTEIKQLLKEYKSMAKIKEKISTWKNEGYNVAQLEKMIDDVKQPTIKKQKKAKDDLINKGKDKYCPKCGSNIEGNPKFCKDCGTEL